MEFSVRLTITYCISAIAGECIQNFLAEPSETTQAGLRCGPLYFGFSVLLLPRPTGKPWDPVLAGIGDHPIFELLLGTKKNLFRGPTGLIGMDILSSRNNDIRAPTERRVGSRANVR